MGKLSQKGLDALLKKPPKRHPDGDGLFFKTARDRKAYWTYRFTLAGKETERSIGPYPNCRSMRRASATSGGWPTWPLASTRSATGPSPRPRSR